MARYHLSRKADSDIAAHYEYGIFTFGLDQAQNYMLGLYDRITDLADHPTYGRSAEELARGLRRFEYGAHVIFYTTEDDGVFIVRVLRKEMDFKRHL